MAKGTDYAVGLGIVDGDTLEFYRALGKHGTRYRSLPDLSRETGYSIANLSKRLMKAEENGLILKREVKKVGKSETQVRLSYYGFELLRNERTLEKTLRESREFLVVAAQVKKSYQKIKEYCSPAREHTSRTK